MEGELPDDNGPAETFASRTSRRMVASKLLGRHTHTTLTGRAVHIWERCGTYLARGRLNGQVFGVTLSKDELEAEFRPSTGSDADRKWCLCPAAARLVARATTSRC